MRRRGKRIVEIGDADGLIALFLDETAAVDLAYLYGPSDDAYDEIMRAVEEAYSEIRPEATS